MSAKTSYLNSYTMNGEFARQQNKNIFLFLPFHFHHSKMHTIHQLRLGLVLCILYLTANITVFALYVSTIEQEDIRNEVIIINACIWACLIGALLSFRLFIAQEHGQPKHECDNLLSAMIWEFGGLAGIIVSCILLSDIAKIGWEFLYEPIFIFTLLPFYGVCLLCGGAIFGCCLYGLIKCLSSTIRCCPECCINSVTSCYKCWCAPVPSQPSSIAPVVIVTPVSSTTFEPPVVIRQKKADQIHIQPNAPAPDIEGVHTNASTKNESNQQMESGL